MKYNRLGQVIESRDVRGVVTTTHYDKLNRVEFVDAPPNGGSSDSNQSLQITQNVYDEVGNLIQVKYPVNRQTTFDFDARNQHIKTTLPAPGVTLPAGMNVRLADAPITNFVYDALGNLQSVSDPRNPAWKTTYDYDDLNRKFRTTEPATVDHGATEFINHFDDAGRLQWIESPGPNGLAITEFQYDRFDRPFMVIPPADANGFQAITTTTYDLRNNVKSVTVDGRTTETTHDQRDRATDVKSPDPGNGHGRMLQHYEYSPIGEVIYSSTYEEGHPEKMIASTFFYDNLSRLVSTTGTDPDANGPSHALTTAYSYDAGGNVLRTIVSGDGAPRQTDTEYDNYNRPWRVQGIAVDGVRPEAISYFDAAGQNVEVREKTSETPSGTAWRMFSYVFDNLGRLFKTTGPADSFGNRPSTYTVADEAGNVRGILDAMGRVTEQVYNSLGELWKVIEPATAEQPTVHPTTTYGYNLAGLVATISDSLPRITTNLYDNVGNLLETALPAVSGVIPRLYYGYDVLGNLRDSTDVEGNTTTFLRDNLGRVTTTILPQRADSAGPATTLVNVYDGLGNLASQTNELTQTTSYEHDLFGRTTKTTFPDPDANGPLASSFVASTHDSFGNVLSQTNAANETTVFGYNARGERTSVTDPRGYTTYLGYDLLGRNIRVQDPEGNVTRFGYDDLGRRLSEALEFSGGGTSSRGYSYDLAGRQTRAVDRLGRVTVYGYDERDQLRTETWYANVLDANAQVNSTGGIGYAYDVVGRMTAAGTTSLGYDALDRVATQTFGHIPGFATLTTTYGDRQDGLRDALSLTIGGVADFINDYDYDERLWMKSVTQTAQTPISGQPTPHSVGTKRAVFHHGDDGRLEHLLRFANVAETQFVAQTDFAYDGGNRLTGIHHFKPAQPTNATLAQYSWSYDGADRIEHLTNSDGNVTYAYDDRGQLIGADYAGASQPADAVYNYDHNGNRDDAGFVIVEHNLAESDGTYSYLYDAEGNRTHRTSLATGEVDLYTWDNRNRLTAVTHFTSTGAEVWDVEYQYDYANRLIVRTETLAGQTSTIQRFVYDGNQMVLETNGSGQVTHRYLWGEAVDQILADESLDLVSGVGTTRWTLTDHQSTVRDLATYNSATDTTSIVDHIIYDAFGKLTSESSPTNSTSLKFTGHYLDPLTGQQWNLNRWYDPGLHQWLSVDPILFEAGDPNPRRFVGNDPVNRVDPSGLEETYLFKRSNFEQRCMACHQGGFAARGMRDEEIAEMSAMRRMYVKSWYHQPGPETQRFHTGAQLIGSGTEVYTGVVLFFPSGFTSTYLIADGISNAGGAIDAYSDGALAKELGVKRVDFVGEVWENASERGTGELFGNEHRSKVPGQIGRALLPLAFGGMKPSVPTFKGFTPIGTAPALVMAEGTIAVRQTAAISVPVFGSRQLAGVATEPLLVMSSGGHGARLGLPESDDAGFRERATNQSDSELERLSERGNLDELLSGGSRPASPRPGGTGKAYDPVNGQGVYILKDPRGVIRYTGRGDVHQRLADHVMPGSGKEDLIGQILFDNTLPASQAESLEHELMQIFGGPKSTNPSTLLRNKIQGIGETNLNFLRLEFAADDELVIEALKRAGYLPR